MKYARLRDKHLIDVYRIPEDFADLDMLNRCLPGGDFITVPDSAVNGAVDNGDGTFTNPQPPPSQVIYTTLSATAFQDVCETGLSSQARFGKIIRDMSASADDQVFSAYQRFMKSITFDRSKAAPLFTLLVAKGLMTTQERTAILNAWPST